MNQTPGVPETIASMMASTTSDERVDEHWCSINTICAFKGKRLYYYTLSFSSAARTMSSNDASDHDRKRKPTNIIPETVSSNNGRNPKKRKARRVSTTNALVSTAASSLRVDTPARPVTDSATTANAVSAASKYEESIQSTAAEHEESMKSLGALIQDLFCSDSATVDAVLDALDLDLSEDKKKYERFVTAGGCLALVQLLKKCLDKAIDSVPACDQVTELNELPELTTFVNTLMVITNLTFCHDESAVGIAAIGGVEAVVKVMKTFPKCQLLQEHACIALANLAGRNIGKANAIESGGIEFILAALTKHLDSASLCEHACSALFNIVHDSKEHTGRLITLGGGAAVDKVRTKWADNNYVQTQVRDLAGCFAAEWKARYDEE
jgi:hypothetical protein